MSTQTGSGELAPSQHLGQAQSRHHHHFIKMYFVLAMIWLIICSPDVKQQSYTHYAGMLFV
jgi:hypothetical protein